MKIKKKDEELITKSVIIFIAFGFLASFLIYFLKEPEGFTQLYFEDYEALPYSVDVNKEYPIKFTLVSFENEPTDYIAKATDGKEWYFTLKPKENKTVSFYFTPEKDKLPANYTISLLNKNQSIYFWYGSTKAKIKENPPEKLVKRFFYKIPIEITNNELSQMSYRITSNQSIANITLNPGENATINLYITPKGLLKMDKYTIAIEGSFKQLVSFKYRVKE